MRNFKDIIVEKLKVSIDNTFELPDMEDFTDAIYSFNTGHDIYFEDIDYYKYNDTKNCPKYKRDGKLYYVFSLFVSRPMNGNKVLHLICSINDYTPAENFIINSMDRLVEVLGEELILQIWDYIK